MTTQLKRIKKLLKRSVSTDKHQQINANHNSFSKRIQSHLPININFARGSSPIPVYIFTGFRAFSIRQTCSHPPTYSSFSRTLSPAHAGASFFFYHLPRHSISFYIYRAGEKFCRANRISAATFESALPPPYLGQAVYALLFESARRSAKIEFSSRMCVCARMRGSKDVRYFSPEGKSGRARIKPTALCAFALDRVAGPAFRGEWNS